MKLEDRALEPAEPVGDGLSRGRLSSAPPAQSPQGSTWTCRDCKRNQMSIPDSRKGVDDIYHPSVSFWLGRARGSGAEAISWVFPPPWNQRKPPPWQLGAAPSSVYLTSPTLASACCLFPFLKNRDTIGSVFLNLLKNPDL